MRHTLNHERSLRHESGTQRQQDDQSGNTLKPCAAKLRGSDKRSPVPPNFACQKRERERESCAFHALWPSAIAAATNNTSNTNQTNHTNHTNERTNEQTNKQTTNKQTPAVTSPWDSTSPMLLTCSQQEPPVGFEPTTSRLLSGCSAN